MNYMMLVSVIGFIALMMLVGVIVSKKVNDADDFFLGGRNVPAFLIIATLLASEVGGGVMLGVVGLAYQFVFGMIVLLPMLLAQPEVGGFTGLFTNAPENFFDVMNVQTAKWRMTTLITMMIAPFVRQYYYQRMFASKSEKIAQRSVFAQAILIVIVTIWTCLVGMCVFMINPALENPESAMPWVLSAVMHPVVAAIVMGAICATVMSTADTFLNAGSLTFVMDILKNVRTEEMSQEKSLKIARYSSLAVGAIALVIAIMSSSVVSALMNAWSILGGGLFVPMVVSYFYKPSTKEGVMAAMIAGLLTTLLFTIVIKSFVLPAIVCGLIVAFVTLVVVSAMTKNKATA